MTRRLALLALLLPGLAQALMPDRLNYQGRLLDSVGAPVADSAANSATFRLYDAPGGGSLVWSETRTNIATSKGLFNIELGAVTPLSGVPFDVPYWLEISWDKLGTPETMAPRQPLSSGPYAFRAKQLQHPYADGSMLNGNSGIFISNGGSGAGTGAIKGSSFAGVGLSGVGLTGTAGAASAAGGIGVVAEQGPGDLALYSDGRALFLGGSAGAVSATSSSLPIYARNTLGGGFLPAIVGEASGTGLGVVGRSSMTKAQGGLGGGLIAGTWMNGVGVHGLAGGSSWGVFGEGENGVYAKVSHGTGVALKAEATAPLARALWSLGNAQFDGAGNTVTFATYVSFTGGTNLSSEPVAPLSLSATAAAAVLGVFQGGSGPAVYGDSPAGYGVRGMSVSSLGVYGQSVNGHGVYGQTGSAGQFGVYGNGGSNGGGVFGIAQDPSQYGVVAQQNANGTALRVVAGNGTAIQAIGGGMGLSVSVGDAAGVAGSFTGSSTANLMLLTQNGAGEGLRINQNGSGTGLVSVAQSGFGIDGYSYSTGATYGVRGLMAGNGASGAGTLGYAYGSANTGAGVEGNNSSPVGVGVKAVNTAGSSNGGPAIALDIDGGIQVKTRTDGPAGTQNLGLPNLSGGGSFFCRQGNGNIVSNQVKGSSLVLLTVKAPTSGYGANVELSARVTNVVNGQADYNVTACAGFDPGMQAVDVQYLIINQR